MNGMQRTDFDVRMEAEGVEFRTREVGGMTMSWARVAKGTDFAPALKGLPDDLCQCPHWGFVIQGRIRVKTSSGDQIYDAGQAYYWGPGHAPEVLEDCEYVEVSPTSELEDVIAHVTSGG